MVMTAQDTKLKPGYKKTEIGVIPEDWKVMRLEELGSWKGGGTPSMANINFWINGTIYWASSGDIKTRILSKTASMITEKAVKQSSTTLLQEGAILIVTRSGILRKYLPVAKNTMPLAINQDIKALIPNSQVSVDYLLQVLSSRGSDILSTCMKTGTTVESVEYPWLKRYRIPLPSLPEQQAIASALSDVDALITSLDRLIAKKRDIKQATMQHLLTGKTRLPGFNGEREMKKVEEIAPLQRGFDLPTSQLKEGVYPVVYSNGVLNYHHSNFKVRAPGVITGRSGTIGKVHYIEDDYWPHNTTLWVTDFKGNSPKYIYYLYMNIKLERFGTGSGVPTMNRNDVHTYQMSIPPFLEQQAIANILSDMDAEIATLEQKRDKIYALKQGMMQVLLTGKTRLV